MSKRTVHQTVIPSLKKKVDDFTKALDIINQSTFKQLQMSLKEQRNKGANYPKYWLMDATEMRQWMRNQLMEGVKQEIKKAKKSLDVKAKKLAKSKKADPFLEEIVKQELKYARKKEAKQILENSRRRRRLMYQQQIEMLSQGPFPLTAESTLVLFENGNTIRIPGQATKLINPDHATGWIDRQYEKLVSYNVQTQHPNALYEIEIRILPNPGQQYIRRVAQQNIRPGNCMLNLLEDWAKQEKQNYDNGFKNIYKQHPFLVPKNTDDIFIDQDIIADIAKKLQIRIMLYSPLGAKTGLVWNEFGGAHKKSIKIRIQDEHATIIPGSVPVNQVNYVNYIGSKPPKDAIDFGMRKVKDDDYCTYYTTVSDSVMVTHKTFRPSSVTGMKKDDMDPAYFKVFSAESMLYQLFKQDFDLKPIVNPHARLIAKTAEHFITRNIIIPLSVDKKYIEYDHNKNYVSYSSSEIAKYYKGFPGNFLVPCKLEDAEFPAFYVVNSITNAPKAFTTLLPQDKKVITAPIYSWLVDHGAMIDVDFVMTTKEGGFKDINIIKWTEEQRLKYNTELLNDDTTLKMFRNSLIGRTITGGIRETDSLTIKYGNQDELNQMIFECELFDEVKEFSWDETYFRAKIKKSAGRCKGMFNFHSYILSYAAIQMLEKFIELENLGYPVCAYNVDSLVIEFNANAPRPMDQYPGGWKTQKVTYETKKSLFVMPSSTQCAHDDITESVNHLRVYTDRKPVLRDQLILGAGGIGKSYTYLCNPLFDSVVSAPTIRTRNAHKDTAKTAGHEYIKGKGGLKIECTEKQWQTNVDDETFKFLRQNSKVTAEHNYAIIDEFTMLDSGQLETIYRRQGSTVFIFIGDMEQICNSINNRAIKISDFHQPIEITYKTRIEGAPARHSYEFGCLLDEFRGKSAAIQTDMAISKFTRCNLEQLEGLIKETNVGLLRIIVGDNKTAKKYNDIARKLHAMIPCINKSQGKNRGQIEYLPTWDHRIWWGRQSMTDVRPKGYWFEPAYAVTVDSFQGQTVDHAICVDLASCTRQGTLYTAITRPKKQKQIYLI